MIYHSQEFAEAAGSGEGFRVMILAAKALAATALDFLLDPQFQNRVREDFAGL